MSEEVRLPNRREVSDIRGFGDGDPRGGDGFARPVRSTTVAHGAVAHGAVAPGAGSSIKLLPWLGAARVQIWIVCREMPPYTAISDIGRIFLCVPRLSHI